MRPIFIALLATNFAFPLMGQDDQGWTDLFDGNEIQGWENPFDWGEAVAADGEIRLTASKKFFLVAPGRYADFVFEGEIMLPRGKANSGFMFRCHKDSTHPKIVYGYQAEVDGSDRRWSGGLYDEGRRGWIWPSKKGRSKDTETLTYEEESQAYFKREEVAGALDRDGWNKYRITCKGNRLKIEVNDVVTTDIEDDTDAEGHIAIQHHGEQGQTYRFRNLRIKEI